MKLEVNDFNLYDIVTSGMSFRNTLELDNSFTIILSDRVINIKQIENNLIVKSNNMNDIENVIVNYFDLDTPYDSINKSLSKYIDVSKCNGYKILRQDKFEMFISYIISQNNNVKRISNTIENISKKYGKHILWNNKDYYLFPTFNDLKDITIDDLKDFKLGFRDKYIMNALEVLKRNPDYLDELDSLSTEEAIKSLTTIKGIGLKVSSCILLFGYHRFDTFPIDTWVKKYVSNNYNIKDDIKLISNFMKDKFNIYSGLVIQYFYHLERNKK